MAQVSDDPRTRAERLLGYLEAAWGAIPETAREWHDWDPLDREVFHLEWVVKEDALKCLREFEVEDQLDPVQVSRFQALLQMITRNRAVLERMLTS